MTEPDKRARRRMLLFIGNPTDFTEVARWAEYREWATRHDLVPTRALTESVVCAVAPTRVLQHHCSTADALLLQRARDHGIPCVSVIDDPGCIADLIEQYAPIGPVQPRRCVDPQTRSR